MDIPLLERQQTRNISRDRAAWVTGDGVQLRGEVGGVPTAPAVILMHGGGQTLHSWSGGASALIEAGYRVIAYDARGHGDSGWSSTADYTLATRARDLATIVQDIEGPFGLIGASLGGATALKALSDGMRPKTVSLIDIVPKPDMEGVLRIRRFMKANPDGFGSLEDAADAVATFNVHRRRPRSPLGLARNLRLRSDGRYYWHWDPEILSFDPLQDLTELEEVLTTVVAAADVAVQLVRGMKSDVVDDHGVAELRRLFPTLHVDEIPDAGHMVAGDRNDVFNHAIIAFFRKHLPSA
ncbi:alpha/beta fold hydrolase [Sphingobium phenoxybenzoativorans]|uniref:Alpha/beta fold hydrolase n=1 Tax=Sphingobium phenoxybenzoativorans TaxID=1592790 RepID=A0A975K8P0_9SPHN|nr:alpha/beta fold hydrolase [Sphingobium phenoxybenzoativorans]QUT06856.1 alpha/beta fold hydrolase [Sphingobium phenoxybenzoativorans]